MLGFMSNKVVSSWLTWTRNHLGFKVSSGVYLIKKKSSNTDNNSDISIGDSGERILVSNFSIKSSEGIVFVSELRLNTEVKGVSSQIQESQKSGVYN